MNMDKHSDKRRGFIIELFPEIIAIIKKNKARMLSLEGRSGDISEDHEMRVGEKYLMRHQFIIPGGFRVYFSLEIGVTGLRGGERITS